MRKPKVALLYDQEGWSFHHIAIQIEKHLGDLYEVRSFSFHRPDRAFLLEADVAICLWYGALQFLQQGREEGAFWQQRIVPAECKLVACVFDEVLRWHEVKIQEVLASICRSADLVMLSCDGMQRRLFPELPLPKRILFCEDGVDLSLFSYAPHREGVRDLNSPLRIGWVGNSDPTHFGKIKGLDLIKEAAGEVEGVELVYHDRDKHGLLPHERMPAFYEGIDLYVCMSACEGTPNPILEASATGRGWLSTDVGICSSFLEDASTLYQGGEPCSPGWIIPREVSILKAALERLRDDRDLVVRMGIAAFDTAINFWGWERKAEQYTKALQLLGVAPC